MATTRSEVGARKRARTRGALIEAAMRVFARVGPDTATIDDIIAEAVVARGTFYNYFDTRDDVLVAVAAQISDSLLADIAQLRQAADPADRVSRTVRAFIRMAARRPTEGWVVVRIALFAAPFDLGMKDSLTADVAAGLAEGRFRIPSVQAAYDAILGLGLMGMRSVLRGEAGVGHAEHVATLVLAALGVADAAAIANRPMEAPDSAPMPREQTLKPTRPGMARRTVTE